MRSTMMDRPLSLNDVLERAGRYFADNTIVSRLPDKSLRTHRYGEWHRRTRALASALQRLGLRPGDRVATLCWNHHAHLEAYFGIPAAGGVMHTLNLRLSPAEIGAIARDADDRFLVVDDILLPLAREVMALHRFERVIVFPFSGAPVEPGLDDYERLLAAADPDGFAPCAAPRGRCGGHVLHVRHHRRRQGRRLLAPLDDPACAGGQPARPLGHAQHRRAAAGGADVPCQRLGHALWCGDDRHEDSSSPARTCRRPTCST